MPFRVAYSLSSKDRFRAIPRVVVAGMVLFPLAIALVVAAISPGGAKPLPKSGVMSESDEEALFVQLDRALASVLQDQHRISNRSEVSLKRIDGEVFKAEGKVSLHTGRRHLETVPFEALITSRETGMQVTRLVVDGHVEIH